MQFPARSLAFVALAAAAGCSFDRGGVDIEPGNVDAPPAEIDASDTTPDAEPGAPDAAPDGAPDARVDTDGDGVIDADDNCPRIGNADQRDHDDDNRGDLCDGCPHLADPDPVDTDGDGIGNVCDPRPGLRDRLVRFDGFYDDADGVPAGWLNLSGGAGDWSTHDGVLEQDSGGLGTHLIILDQQLAGQIIEAQLHILAVAGGPGTRTVGVAGGTSRTDGNAPLWMCVLRDDPATAGDVDLRLIEQENPVSFPDPTVADSPVALAAGVDARLRLHLEDNGTTPVIQNEACRMVTGTTTTDTPLRNDAGITTSGHVGLRTNGVRATYDYAVVYAPAQ